jgi:putative N6-adenine-specific DNA methylase
VAFPAFAVTAPGLERLASAELLVLGVTPSESERGGLGFEASESMLASVLLNVRTVTRVLVRAAEFRATSFAQLERRAKAIPWERWVGPGVRARFRVTCRKSRLYHSDAVAQRLASALVGVVPGATIADGPVDEDDGDETAQLFVVRFADDVCTVSVDPAGAPLHKRGYRQAVAKAPLRETLAAAMLMGTPWDRRSALCDPLCGSGTIVIEGALLARRIAPGLHREFSAERWPSATAAVWREARAAAAAEVLPKIEAPFVGSDRDEGAVAAARANAERAGVGNDVAFSHLPISAVRAPASGGLLITNPPYGVRVGDSHTLRDLYAQFGHVAREHFAGWHCAVLSADRTPGHALERQIGRELSERWRSSNGGIPVRLVSGDVPHRFQR